MYTRKEIVKETALTALFVLYLNPFAHVLSVILWAAIIYPLVVRTPFSILIGGSITLAAWIAAHRMAKKSLAFKHQYLSDGYAS